MKTTNLLIMKEFADYLKANPQEAREFFKQAGILDEEGNLTSPYKEHKSTTCSVCYLKLDQMLCVSCPRTNCPTGLGPVIS